MKRVSATEAIAYYCRLPAHLQAPSLHPAYVEADALRDRSLEPLYLIYEQDGDFLYYAPHRSPTPLAGFFDLQSPYGYGGPASTSEDPGFVAAADADFKRWCCHNRILAEFVRFHPLLENWRFCGAESRFDRRTVWIDLDTQDLFSGYATRVRTAIRKAEKLGLRVNWVTGTEFLAKFPQIYRETMARLGAADFYDFSDQYFEALTHWKDTLCALCIQGDEVVGGAIFLMHNQFVEYHLSGSTETGRKLGATNLLLHAAAAKAKSLGAKKLHLGGGTSAAGDNPLLFFKQGFSPNSADFRIAGRVHDPETYHGLRAAWVAEGRNPSGRVLFYRS